MARIEKKVKAIRLFKARTKPLKNPYSHIYITIPAAIAQLMDVKSGDYVLVIWEDGEVKIKKA